MSSDDDIVTAYDARWELFDSSVPTLFYHARKMNRRLDMWLKLEDDDKERKESLEDFIDSLNQLLEENILPALRRAKQLLKGNLIYHN